MTDVAIVHDFLASRSGGERVVGALAEAFPDAPIHTLIHAPEQTFVDIPADRVIPSVLNASPALRTKYRHTLPVAAMMFRSLKIDAAVTVCSSSGLSHNVRCTGAKAVYCHTPARWIHDGVNYLQGFGSAVRAAAGVARPAMARLDRSAMASADFVMANSQHIADEVRRIYDIDPAVVLPCSSLDIDEPTQAISGIDPGFVLSPTRALNYKRLDVLAEAARLTPDLTFVQIGEGPNLDELRRLAPPNLVALGSVSDAQLRWAYQNARVVALTCAEDFGLVPLEAAAHGVHTVAPQARGLVDHPSEMMTWYPFLAAELLSSALLGAPKPTGQRRSERLGRQRFIREVQTEVDQLRV